MSIVNKELLKNLAELARLDLGGDEKEIMEDLKKIVDYFEELKGIDTEDVLPVSGGTDLVNAFRKDKYDKEKQLSRERVVQAFPEEKNGFLKVPPVFE